MRHKRSFYNNWREIPSRNSRAGNLILLTFLLIVGIILCLTGQAIAQIGEEVKKELDRTDAVIEKAREAVRESRNSKAQNLLEIAINLQKKAKEAFADGRFALAIRLTLQAREKAFEAIGITKRSEENENLVLKALERTDQIIATAKEKVNLTDHPRASSLLEVAIRNQERAKEFYREHNLKLALKLTLKARESAQKSMDWAGLKDDLDRFARRELERTDKLIEKTSSIIRESNDTKAKDFFDKGVDWQEKAWDLFKQNRFKAAIQNTQKAREFVLKALKILEENVTPKMVEKAIQRNDELINQVGPQIRDSGNKEAIQLFEEGLSHQEKAKDYLEDGKLKAALAQAKVADRLITKAFDMIANEGL